MRFKLQYIYCFVAMLVLTLACTKIQETNIDGGGIPAVDGVNVFDTVINVIASNEGLMGLYDETRLRDDEQFPIGKITNDPSFGTIDSKLYLQLQPGRFYNKAYPFGKKDSIVALDSVVISLGYRGAYGDTAFAGDKHGFTVKEIEPNFDFKDSSYRGTGISFYSLNNIGASVPTSTSDLVLSSSFNPSIAEIRALKKFTTTNNAVDSFENVITTKLSTTWGMKFINGTNFDTTNAYLNDSAFVSRFKGLVIEGKNTQNSLLYYDLSSTKTRVRFYYRTKNLAGTGKIDSTYTDFVFQQNTPYNAQAVSITRSPSYNLPAAIGSPAPYGFLDAAPVSNYMKLKTPVLATLSKRILYLAELTVEEDPIPGDMLRLTGNMYQPSVLFIDWYDPLSATYKTPKKDFFVTNQAGTEYNLNTYGGFRKQKVDAATGLNISYYTFNLTRHVQDIISFGGVYQDFKLYAPRYTKPTSYVEASNSWLVPDGLPTPINPLVSGIGLGVNPRAGDGRIRVGGTATTGSTHHMKLRLVYSKI
jgi:hypothetical protein